jgi:hypothetical protein
MAMDRIRSASLAAAITAVCAAAAPAHAARVDYTLDAGVEHDDNVRLVEDGRESQRILRAGLGLLVTEDTAAIRARLAGRADWRDYADDAYSDGVEGVLLGSLDWMLVPGRLSLSVRDALELQPIDRFAADAPDNRQQVNVFSVGPNLLFALGPHWQGRVEARLVDTHAEVTDAFDSRRHGAALRLERALDASAALGVEALWQDVDFDDDASARDHQREEATIGYRRTLARTDVAVDLGYGRIRYADGTRHDMPLARGELGWEPSPRSRLSLIALSQYSDAAEAALADAEPRDGLPPIPTGVLVDDTAINPSVYRERRIGVAWAYTGVRTELRVEPYVQRLRYLDPGEADEDGRGVYLSADRRLTPTLTLSVLGEVARTRYTALNDTDRAWRAELRLDKRWSRHWSTALSWMRYDREGGVRDEHVRQDIWYLRMVYGNRPQ